jgi:hypothetical protein
MTKRPDDPNPEPPGGRASERLKQFEQARKPATDKPKPPASTTKNENSEKEQQ